MTYVERFSAQLSARLELRRYPFDTQNLEIFIHPFYADANQIVFTLSDASVWTASEFSTYSSLAQWNLTALPPTLHLHREQTAAISGVRFRIEVTRRSLSGSNNRYAATVGLTFVGLNLIFLLCAGCWTWRWLCPFACGA
ncbi:MAG: hypothetical protein ACREQR_13060 [Candidatus Binataceae bacterium]